MKHVYGIGNRFCLEGNAADTVTVTILCKQAPPVAFPRASTTWRYLVRNGSQRNNYILPAAELTIPVTVNDTSLTFGPLPLADLNVSNAVFCTVSNGVGDPQVARSIFDICGKCYSININ